MRNEVGMVARESIFPGREIVPLAAVHTVIDTLGAPGRPRARAYSHVRSLRRWMKMNSARMCTHCAAESKVGAGGTASSNCILDESGSESYVLPCDRRMSHGVVSVYCDKLATRRGHKCPRALGADAHAHVDAREETMSGHVNACECTGRIRATSRKITHLVSIS